jgi:ABC-type dipeptide/oligopeptide/nickel transport system permease subunit
MLSELLPHLWAGILVLAPLLCANAVVLESALSSGAGVQPPTPSLTLQTRGGLDLPPIVALTIYLRSSWCW